MTFKKEKYKIVRKAVSKNIVDFVNNYILLKEQVHDTLKDSRYIIPFSDDWGTREDRQCWNAYSHYADIAMETLLVNCLPLVEKETNLKLWPTYAYTRVYKKGHVLEKHTDRESCEVSTTLNLGGDMWSIYLTDKKGKDLLMSKSCNNCKNVMNKVLISKNWKPRNLFFTNDIGEICKDTWHIT